MTLTIPEFKSEEIALLKNRAKYEKHKGMNKPFYIKHINIVQKVMQGSLTDANASEGQIRFLWFIKKNIQLEVSQENEHCGD